MSTHTEKYSAIMRKAIPASGYRPGTEAEWKRLQSSMRRAAVHFYQELGATKAQAQYLANLIYGGVAGRLLLEAAFSDEGER